LTYNVHASAAYDKLETSHVPPPNVGFTSFSTNTAVLDLWQDVSLPFYLGPVKVAPYGVVDLSYYSQDLQGDSRGRFYGGGGVRASMPLSRIYPDVESDLLNLNGINHKIVLSANYYNAWSDARFNLFPQLNRLNDDATDQSIRDMASNQFVFNPNNAFNLNNNAIFDAQTYAIRNLLVLDSFGYSETEDTIQVLQMDVRQRLQTKRGYPGMQHIVDWMVLDTSLSYFPDPNQTNLGKPFGLAMWDWLWNIGDRTALVSDGWIDPFNQAARYFSIGAFLNRPDRTSFYVGYRQTDPLQSRLISGSASYVFSPKYAVTVNGSYDLGLNTGLSNSLVFTRMGSDLQVSVGVGYNSILNNFSFTFAVMPNVAVAANRSAAMVGQNTFGGAGFGH
jgi:hypothetical protein